MNKPLRYTIIGASVLALGYVTYLIYSKLHLSVIDAKTVSSEEAQNQINNI
jgi:putative flippase GtrA